MSVCCFDCREILGLPRGAIFRRCATGHREHRRSMYCFLGVGSVFEAGVCWGFFFFCFLVTFNLKNYYWNYYSLRIKQKTKTRNKTDNFCLYDVIHSAMQIVDEWLCIGIAILREMLNGKDITIVLWIPTDIQVSDPLTKKYYHPSEVFIISQSSSSNNNNHHHHHHHHPV